MARARNIKPGFFQNEELVELPFETRLMFAGLWTLSDREGRLEDRPKRIKMALFPADNIDADVLLTQLCKAKFIIRYVVDGNAYIQIVNFLKHQNPHVKEAASTIPEYRENDASTVLAQCNNDASPADSLIPSSLIPYEEAKASMSGKPDDAQPKSEKSESTKSESIEVLQFLNTKASRNYRPTEVNLQLIKARLKEGYTAQDCKQVIAKKCREWIPDDKMREYLRPATLFNREKFNQYIGEIVEEA